MTKCEVPKSDSILYFWQVNRPNEPVNVNRQLSHRCTNAAAAGEQFPSLELKNYMCRLFPAFSSTPEL